MYKNFNLTDQERREIMEQHQSHGYKKPLNEQKQITSVPDKQKQPSGDFLRLVPDEFPKHPYFSKLPNTSDGGKKVMLDGGGSDVLYPNGKTKSGKCWCHQLFKNSDSVGIIITGCDSIKDHCKGDIQEQSASAYGNK